MTNKRLSALAHYSIRSSNLDEARRFYTEILGLVEGFRPPFDFEGYWLYLDKDEPGLGVVHLVSTGPATSRYLGQPQGAEGNGTGALDHIAFDGNDWAAIRRCIKKAGLPYSERLVPGLGLRQVFLKDPDGITIELNFSGLRPGAKRPVRS